MPQIEDLFATDRGSPTTTTRSILQKETGGIQLNTLNLFNSNKQFHKFTEAEKLTKKSLGYTIITFRGNEYAVDLNSEESREKFKNYVDTMTNESHKWFKEETGNKNWVLYNKKDFEPASLIEDYLRCKAYYDDVKETPYNLSSCYNMFERFTFTNEHDYLSKIDFSKVIDMTDMFLECTFHIGLPDNFNTANVKIMISMFEGSKFRNDFRLPESFDTRKVEFFSHMFSDITAYKKFELSNKFSLASAKKIYYMFSRATFLDDLKISKEFSDSKKIFDMQNPLKDNREFSKIVGKIII